MMMWQNVFSQLSQQSLHQQQQQTLGIHPRYDKLSLQPVMEDIPATNQTHDDDHDDEEADVEDMKLQQEILGCWKEFTHLSESSSTSLQRDSILQEEDDEEEKKSQQSILSTSYFGTTPSNTPSASRMHSPIAASHTSTLLPHHVWEDGLSMKSTFSSAKVSTLTHSSRHGRSRKEGGMSCRAVSPPKYSTGDHDMLDNPVEEQLYSCNHAMVHHPSAILHL
jgi:hypothetical protein